MKSIEDFCDKDFGIYHNTDKTVLFDSEDYTPRQLDILLWFGSFTHLSIDENIIEASRMYSKTELKWLKDKLLKKFYA
jgi:hypothetical protein